MARNTRTEHEVTRGSLTMVWQPCYRCCGSKVFSCWLHIADGVCFNCGGLGGKYASKAKLEKAAARAAKRSAKKQAEHEAAMVALRAEVEARVAARPELARVLAMAAKVEEVEVEDRDGYVSFELACPELGGRTHRDLQILTELANKLQGARGLTEKQTELALKLSVPATCGRCGETGHTERTCSERGRVKAGRQVVEGVVVSEKWQHGPFGGGQMKCLVALDCGAKLWGSKPKTTVVDEECCAGYTYVRYGRGSRVRFTATVETGSDPHFGFYKRPTKLEVLELVEQKDED